MQEVQTNDEDTLEGRYGRLEVDRSPYLQRARENSALTIPQVFPPEGTKGATKLKQLFQSLGAMAVNSLVAKLLLAILPASQAFFRMDVDEITKKKLVADPASDALMTEGLAKVERTVQKNIQSSTLRAKMAEGLKQVVIGGCALLYIKSPKEARVYRLDSYVVQLDAIGNLIEIVVKEKVNKLTLTQTVRDACNAQYTRGKDEEVAVYTGIQLTENGSYKVYQEINKIEVPDSQGSYPADKLPWLPLRWSAADGESYSRGYVDQYIGDLTSVEGLSKSIVQAAAAAAKVIFMVKSGRMTSKRALTNAANGAFIDGDANDVSSLKLDKGADLNVAANTLKSIEDRLRYAFLMTSSIQRAGERVTAEEIRRLATELEDQLGGIYSILAQTLQLPLVNVIIAAMTAAKTLPALPKGLVSISITTGLDALGRGQDADRLTQFKQDIADIPEAVSAIRLDTLVSRFAVARGIDTDSLIKTPQEMAQERQQAQMAQFMQEAGTKMAPELVKGAMAQGEAPAAA